MFDRRLLQNFDWVLLLLTLTICAIGVVSIFSASKGYPGHAEYWIRQIYWIGIGCGVGFFMLLVDFRTIAVWSYALHVLATISLVVILFIDSGGRVNRWFMVGGVAIQPSEFIKFTTVLAVAYYFRDARRVGNISLYQLILPVLFVAIPFLLIVNQPDLGTALILWLIFLPMIVMAGLRWRFLIVLFVGGLVGVGVLAASFNFGYYQVTDKVVASLRRDKDPLEVRAAVAAVQDRWYLRSWALRNDIAQALPPGEHGLLLERVEKLAFRTYISHILRPYQQQRLVTFINPELDPLGAGYHVIQSRVAVGSGQVIGKGYGNSTQGNLNFLPARHTDFIFSIFAEEWGFLGALGLITLYSMLIWRSLSIVFQTHDRFSAFVTMGVVAVIVTQMVINMGMAIGLLPVVGVPLPLFSYGGSSMITLLMGMAILLNIRMRRFIWS